MDEVTGDSEKDNTNDEMDGASALAALASAAVTADGKENSDSNNAKVSIFDKFFLLILVFYF